MEFLTIETLENNAIVKVNKGLLIKYIDIKVCHNPYCACGSFKMVCYNGQISDSTSKVPSFSFEGNIFEESIALYKDIKLTDGKHKERVYDFLNEHLKADEWEKIEEVFLTNKARRINKFKLEEFEDYEYVFEEEQIANPNLRIPMNKIFPLAEMYVVEKDGIYYELVENYCKSIDCKCSLMSFNMFINGGEYFDDFDYDYVTSEIYKDEYAWVIKQLTEDYETLDILLKIKNLKVRCLYGKAILDKSLISKSKLLTELDTILPGHKSELFKNFGRNEKCLCGSGKKFKKCCLRKVEG